MLNGTVREPMNLLSRFRPFPDLFGKPILKLSNSHGSLNFTQIYLRMLKYACDIPYATKCIVLTERSIPVRSPVTLYRRALRSRCYLNISYNVSYGPMPSSVMGRRGKPFAAVNNICQGLYTADFLKIALPTVPLQCEKFGISLVTKTGEYKITQPNLFRSWHEFTGANSDEFLLLNSYLLHNTNVDRPIQRLKEYMDRTVSNDQYTVAEIPQWRHEPTVELLTSILATHARRYRLLLEQTAVLLFDGREKLVARLSLFITKSQLLSYSPVYSPLMLDDIASFLSRQPYCCLTEGEACSNYRSLSLRANLSYSPVYSPLMLDDIASFLSRQPYCLTEGEACSTIIAVYH
ncbi:hypothetical protein J6590_011197 [Homalodisca vitripennis]|nr:hypothetical protein J6590_011197 [Homalodisca vitripennis]